MQTPLFNKSFLSKKVAEYKTEIKDNSAIFLKWHNDNQKEEALQTNFLNDIFGKVLGYEINTGEAEFNLLTEYKTQKDGTKVDGILGFITKDKKDIRVAIELKAKNTINLDSVEKQAFEYRDKIQNIEWVITSNTNEIRLYSAKSGGRLKYQSWTMSELANSLEKQKEFHFFLGSGKLFVKDGVSEIAKLIEDNTKEEESIEKRFYNDYKDLRKKLFNHLREQNPTKEPTTLLSKTQKLLDRVIFVCFCEDLNLLPDKIFTKLLKTAQESFVETTVWQQIKGLFNAIDKGFPQKNINKFNGGLFAKDAELDELVLQDDILKEIIKISDWDFGSELTVNILGHIFEQSITDLEEIKAELENTSHDKKQGKRKKDGVFYTPEYITRYIVEEAVGGWLSDRKNELNESDLPIFTEEELKTKPTKATKEKAQKHFDFWKNYAEKLTSIKVLDPACGSGAFLVEVFNYLENEWQIVNEKINYFAKILGTGSLFEINHNYKDTLKNNIYGVDINFESVQITRLSLWIQTAHNKTALVSLDDNIKCGNSLIDDPAICPKAFKWEDEFPFKFDVVVGNPPYVNAKNSNFTKIHKDFYYNNYKTAEYQLDTFILFIEKAHLLMKNDGNFGMIIPNIILANLFIPKIREYLLSNTAIKSIGLCNKVFENVNVDTIILSTHKGYIQHNQIHINQITESEKSFLRQVSQDNFKQNQGYTFSITVDETASKIIAKMQNNSVKLDDICDINRGLHAYRIGYGNPSQTQEMIKDRIYSSTKVKDETYKLELRGYNIDRYSLSIFPENEYISYGEWLAEPRQPKFFEGERILMRKVPGVKNLICSFTSENYIVDQSLYIAKINNDNFNALFILSALNSRLCTGIFKIYTTNLMIYSHKLKLDSLGNSQSHKSSPKNKSH